MPTFLIGAHAFLGEAGALMFLWVLVELLNPSPERLRRARIVSMLGTFFLIAAWVVGGYYYVKIYGAEIKPIIKGGPMPWAHSIVTETKEHVFLFLPFLAFLAAGMISSVGEKLAENKRLKVALITLCGLIVLFAFAMAALGVTISSGFRSALESKVLSPVVDSVTN
jgi:hypothetical protein